ncbi:hypothetical protein ABL78_7132 [Leptomonas seymouri]|uniref:Uncharacterized protein n=1 Tax=Leptomonas seymouri TaxID=5684 RepID=A0A0N0P3M1_LEPSE|nr:hypothetical protein ABL78_7132 [Leptomonas seymouri]|eukprot:KPI83827.1 hypothetical protein ABL78_7132 [Leptomonas seymouri]
MELAIDDKTVLLTTHKTYCETEELHSLRAISEYSPLQVYLQSCANRGALPSAVVVRSLHRVAHRIIGAVVDIVYDDAATHTTTAHVLQLSNVRPALFMPIIVVDGERYALLAQESLLSQGLCPVKTCIRGFVDEAGHFVATTHEAALRALGIPCLEAKPLSSQTFTIGNEGEAPVQIFSVTLTWSAETLGTATASSELVIVPLDGAFGSGDAGASLSASLLLQQQ